jgi:hypothetical protein
MQTQSGSSSGKGLSQNTFTELLTQNIVNPEHSTQLPRASRDRNGRENQNFPDSFPGRFLTVS